VGSIPSAPTRYKVVFEVEEKPVVGRVSGWGLSLWRLLNRRLDAVFILSYLVALGMIAYYMQLT